MITAKLQGKTAIQATIKLQGKTVIQATICRGRKLHADVQGIRPDTMPAEYDGTYSVTPTQSQQELQTDGKRMAANVTVQAIPYYEVSNPQNGKTIIIGV